MVNTEDFIKRLEKILDYYSLTASTFADQIGVQRSSLSHLLSGRNKPSLDFVMKVVEVFPEVDLYWILNGKGNFPKQNDWEEKQVSTPIPEKQTEIKKEESLDLFSTATPLEEKNNLRTVENVVSAISSSNPHTEIERIVIFFKNGSFKSYENN
jgi:transcriptional regulator with XRE-family HTH domain